jgi:hypothetical protein
VGVGLCIGIWRGIWGRSWMRGRRMRVVKKGMMKRLVKVRGEWRVMERLKEGHEASEQSGTHQFWDDEWTS